MSKIFMNTVFTNKHKTPQKSNKPKNKSEHNRIWTHEASDPPYGICKQFTSSPHGVVYSIVAALSV